MAQTGASASTVAGGSDTGPGAFARRDGGEAGARESIVELQRGLVGLAGGGVELGSLGRPQPFPEPRNEATQESPARRTQARGRIRRGRGSLAALGIAVGGLTSELSR